MPAPRGCGWCVSLCWQLADRTRLYSRTILKLRPVVRITTLSELLLNAASGRPDKQADPVQPRNHETLARCGIQPMFKSRSTRERSMKKNRLRSSCSCRPAKDAAQAEPYGRLSCNHHAGQDASFAMIRLGKIEIGVEVVPCRHLPLVPANRRAIAPYDMKWPGRTPFTVLIGQRNDRPCRLLQRLRVRTTADFDAVKDVDHHRLKTGDDTLCPLFHIDLKCGTRAPRGQAPPKGGAVRFIRAGGSDRRGPAGCARLPPRPRYGGRCR